jgi:hydroxymethylglutaryl-CoA lyase
MEEQCTLPWGAHMHSTYEEASAKANAAIEAGCRRIDTALRGFGGCPFASDALIGNMPTEKVLTALESSVYAHELDPLMIESAYNSALSVFSGRE